MTISNRAELVPAQTVALEFVVFLSAGALALAAGPRPVGVVATQLLLLYVVGGYDRRSMGTSCRARRVAVASAGALAFLIGADELLSVALTGASVVAVAVAHVAVTTYLSTGVSEVLITYPGSESDTGDAIRGLVALAGYPATLRRSSRSETWTATFLGPRAGGQSAGDAVSRTFRPSAFCEIALRAIPPHLYERAPKQPFRLGAYVVTKRLVDALAACLVLIGTAPICLAAAIGIVLSDGTPILFRQTRVGFRGKRFTLIKFRTLRPEPERTIDPTSNMEEREFDFGSFLRRARIDELPQLLHVIGGQMSLVGPRPEMEYYHNRHLEVIPHYRERLSVPPGLTGWAQINYPHSTTDSEYFNKTAYDLWYVRNNSLFTDTKILLKTLGTVLQGFGAK
jgi:lipopolysaccharide/colanic/teichoic acid biosynthesis glycosyltransferase